MTKERRPALNRRTFIVAGAGAAVGFLVGRYSEAAGELRKEPRLYFPETGHSIKPPFLDFFRKYGLEVTGYPISEPTPEGGKQYFQNIIVEYGENDYYDYFGGRPKENGVPQCRVYPLGWTVLCRQRYPSEPLNPPPPKIGEYKLHELFEGFYGSHGGIEIFGYPVTEHSAVGTNAIMQFLTNCILLSSLETGEVAVSRLAEYYYQVKMPEAEKNHPWFQPVAKKE